MGFSLQARAAILTLVLALLLAAGRTAAAGSGEALQLIDRLEARLSQCRDYQYRVSSFERMGERQEERCYRLFIKNARLVRIRVVEGRGKGSEAVLTDRGKVRARKGGLLKAVVKTLPPDDHRVCSLRGTPFWEAACHNFLKHLRARVAQPETHCAVEPDREHPSLLLLCVQRPGEVRERYWIDTELMHVVRGEIRERDVLVEQFVISEVRENVGLKDDFFSF